MAIEVTKIPEAIAKGREPCIEALTVTTALMEVQLLYITNKQTAFYHDDLEGLLVAMKEFRKRVEKVKQFFVDTVEGIGELTAPLVKDALAREKEASDLPARDIKQIIAEFAREAATSEVVLVAGLEKDFELIFKTLDKLIVQVEMLQKSV